MGKAICWTKETVNAKLGNEGKGGKYTVGAPCARTLDKDGKCPKHGSNTSQKRPKELN